MNENPTTLPNEPELEDEKRKKRKALIALITVLAAAGLVTWLIIQASDIKNLRGGAFYDQNAQQIQDEIDRTVEDGYFNMNINTKIPVYEGTTALADIKNIEGNHFDCIVTITLEDGTEVYKSGGLAPGNKLETITLNQALEPGEYQGTALFEVYDQNDEHTKAGQTASKVTLFVQ